MKDSLSKYVLADSDSEVEHFHLATDGQDGSYLQESCLLGTSLQNLYNQISRFFLVLLPQETAPEIYLTSSINSLYTYTPA